MTPNGLGTPKGGEEGKGRAQGDGGWGHFKSRTKVGLGQIKSDGSTSLFACVDIVSYFYRRRHWLKKGEGKEREVRAEGQGWKTPSSFQGPPTVVITLYGTRGRREGLLCTRTKIKRDQGASERVRRDPWPATVYPGAPGSQAGGATRLKERARVGGSVDVRLTSGRRDPRPQGRIGPRSVSGRALPRPRRPWNLQFTLRRSTFLFCGATIRASEVRHRGRRARRRRGPPTRRAYAGAVFYLRLSPVSRKIKPSSPSVSLDVVESRGCASRSVGTRPLAKIFTDVGLGGRPWSSRPIPGVDGTERRDSETLVRPLSCPVDSIKSSPNIPGSRQTEGDDVKPLSYLAGSFWAA